MRLFTLALFILSFSLVHAQSTHYIKVSGGKMFFGTGDLPGYAVYTEFSSSLGKGKDSYWRHFQLGGELGFEAGATLPQNKSLIPRFGDKFFQQASNSFLFAKLSYYPVKQTFLRGLHVAVGPTIGYTINSYEVANEAVAGYNNVYDRYMKMIYDRYVSVGYKVSLGYEYYFGKRKRMIIGARIDFENNQKGDANTMYGGKLGYSF